MSILIIEVSNGLDHPILAYGPTRQKDGLVNMT